MKKVLGIGNALVDILIPVENDAILETLALPKGSMQLVDKNRSNSVLEAMEGRPRSVASGGSAANTIHGVAKLGTPTGYIGVVGEDEFGGDFVRDMIRAGSEPHMIHSGSETGRAVALISPDSERTFATFLGAAIELTGDHLENLEVVFSNYHYLHLEGYLVQNHDLVRKAVILAKKYGLSVSLDLASYNVVEANRAFLDEIITEYVDIVFANEEEARAFTGKEPQEALDLLASKCNIAVVKTGSKGSLIKSGSEVIPVGVIPVKPIDTTGAGDLYASGFLFGLANNKPLQTCGEFGAILAGNVIEFMGPKMTEERWVQIRGVVF
jgi:sugar/nucleoside kinase (ribokinase family)